MAHLIIDTVCRKALAKCVLRQSPYVFYHCLWYHRRHLSSDTYNHNVRHCHYEQLQQMLPHVVFSSNVYERERHGHGESYHPAKMPDIVANPTSIEDVQIIIKHCVKHRIPVIPFGAGEWLS